MIPAGFSRYGGTPRNSGRQGMADSNGGSGAGLAVLPRGVRVSDLGGLNAAQGHGSSVYQQAMAAQQWAAQQETLYKKQQQGAQLQQAGAARTYKPFQETSTVSTNHALQVSKWAMHGVACAAISPLR